MKTHECICIIILSIVTSVIIFKSYKEKYKYVTNYNNKIQPEDELINGAVYTNPDYVESGLGLVL